LRRYYPLRFYTLYPAYVVLGATRAVGYMADHHPSTPKRRLLGELCRSFLPTLWRAWRGPAPAPRSNGA
jgi:hypothetical protein